MFYFVVQEKPALLDFFLQGPGREDQLVPGGEAVQALDGGQGHQGVDAHGVEDFIVVANGDDVHGAVEDPRRHVIGHHFQTLFF